MDTRTGVPLVDTIQYYSDSFSSGYNICSSESKDALPEDFEDLDGISQQGVKGYHADTPFDRFYDIRQEMVDMMEDMGINVRYHHHEVGLSSQQEIENRAT
jgi:glutamine synthetase